MTTGIIELGASPAKPALDAVKPITIPLTPRALKAAQRQRRMPDQTHDLAVERQIPGRVRGEQAGYVSWDFDDGYGAWAEQALFGEPEAIGDGVALRQPIGWRAIGVVMVEQSESAH
jgi:hypothetical protein